MRSESPFIFPEYLSDLSSDDEELVQGPSVSMSTEMSKEEELEPLKKHIHQELEVPTHVAQIQKMENQRKELASALDDIKKLVHSQKTKF